MGVLIPWDEWMFWYYHMVLGVPHFTKELDLIILSRWVFGNDGVRMIDKR